jgi:hypothetical protein
VCESIDVDDVLANLDNDSRTLVDRPVYGLSDTTLTDAVATTQTVIGRLVAVQAALVREIDGRGLVRCTGAANAAVWLRDQTHISITAAHAITSLGALLDQRPGLADAMISGAMTPDQALIIGHALAELPEDCEPEIVDAAAALLTEHARRFEPALLRKLGDRVLTHIAPDLADAVLQRRLDRDERQAARDRTLTLSPDGHGRTRLRGTLDTASAATVRAALEPLMTPLPASPAGPDLRTIAMRRADALVEVCRLALRTGDLPTDGGQAAQVNVTIDYAALAAATGSAAGSATGWASSAATTASAAGRLDTGEAVSAGVIRQIACDARILPVVLDGHSVPLDIGRARRLYTGAARTAILIRDGGCAFPGCDRPPKWCDIHHIHSWIHGGPTNRDNGVALCGFHHRLVHTDTWTIVMGPDRRPDFIAPRHIDPTRAPHRNTYHLRT